MGATSGVHTAEDVLKLTMAGADVTFMTSALLKHGPDHLIKIKEDLVQWMEEHEYESLDQMRGSMSMKNVTDPAHSCEQIILKPSEIISSILNS